MKNNKTAKEMFEKAGYEFYKKYCYTAPYELIDFKNKQTSRRIGVGKV